MNVPNARKMNNICKNWCIIYLTSSSPAGFGALHLAFYFLWYSTNIAVLCTFICWNNWGIKSHRVAQYF